MAASVPQNRWCLVTGASSGIGLAVVKELLSNGFCVAGVARHTAPLAQLGARWPGALVKVAHDVSCPGLLERLAAHGVPAARLELVVHSAACAHQGMPLTQMQDEDLGEIVATNVLGTSLVVRDLAAVLMRRASGTIVVLGSVAAQDAAPLMAAYAASKAYVQQLVRCVRSDLHGSGVRVSCLQPGTTRTGLLDRQPGLNPSERFAGFTPLEAEDIARTVLWIHQQPPHVNVQEMNVYPVAQSLFVRGVHRRRSETAALADTP